MALNVTYDVKESGIQKIHMTEHRGFLTDIIRSAQIFSREIAPSRTGRLKRGIQPKLATVVGPSTVQASLFSTAKHGKWVNDGTPDQISAEGKAMFVPKTKGNVRGALLSREHTFPVGAHFPKKFVSGQEGVQYIERGVDMALRLDRRTSGTGTRRDLAS